MFLGPFVLANATIYIYIYISRTAWAGSLPGPYIGVEIHEKSGLRLS